MKTSCFNNYTGDRGLAICLYPPVDWTGPIYLKLAPTREIFYDIKHGKITQEEYIKRYKKDVLEKLNPQETYEMLKNYVLLCYEKPLFDINNKIINEGKSFCHRHLVSKWLSEKLKIEISEWVHNEKIRISSNPLF